MQKSAKIIIFATIICLFGLFFIWKINPESAFWMPKCWWHALTGYNCPGCGSTRALHALLHGQWQQAWMLNSGMFFTIPLALTLIAIEITNPKSKWVARLAFVLAAIVSAWWIIRTLLNI